MSGLVMAPNLEINDELKDAEINGVVVQNENDATLGATTASPSEPDSDAIKMFVGQIPRHWNETDCRRLFETYGAVFSCNILRDKSTQSSKGCCFVTFYHRKDAIEAQGALHNVKVIDGMHHPVQMKPADTENRNERKLFIGQLSKRHNEEDLRTIFSKYGMIEDCSVLRDQDGKSRGCAFVTFTNRSCAVIATKEMHHSQTMEGCAAPLVVKFADTQKDKDVKQKHGVFVGGTTSPKSALLGSLNPGLIQQLGGGGQNIQAVASLLSLLGGQQGQPVNQQPNVLGILGSVLSALSKLTENGNDEQSSSSSSAKQSSSSGSHLEQIQNHSQNPPIPSHSHPHQQQSQQQQHHNSTNSKSFPNSSSSASSSSSSAASSSAAHHQQLAQFLPQAAVAQTAPGQLDAFTQAHLAQIQQHNQLLALQGYAVQQQNSQGQAGLGGGLAGAKTTSPVAATLPTHTQTIALTPYGGAAVDPYQSAVFQQHQQLALLANLQAANNATATSQAGSIVGNGDVKGPEGSNLFIYHLPQDFGDADLLNTFVPFGAVLSAKVFIDKVTNLSKCFGFVSFDNPSSAANAIQAMNGFQIGSKRLKVQLKVERGNPYNR